MTCGLVQNRPFCRSTCLSSRNTVLSLTASPAGIGDQIDKTLGDVRRRAYQQRAYPCPVDETQSGRSRHASDRRRICADAFCRQAALYGIGASGRSFSARAVGRGCEIGSRISSLLALPFGGHLQKLDGAYASASFCDENDPLYRDGVPPNPIAHLVVLAAASDCLGAKSMGRGDGCENVSMCHAAQIANSYLYVNSTLLFNFMVAFCYG